MTGADSNWIAKKTAEGSGWVVFTGGSRQAIGFIAGIVLARVLYPSGTRQSDWAHDLPILLETQWSANSPN